MDKGKLNELISSIDFSKPYCDNSEGHRAIYDHCDRIYSPDASSTIPPSLVFYAARNILLPSFIIGQIPDLLNLLAAVETFRRFAIIKSDEALKWQIYYENEKSHGREEVVRLLAIDEVRTLQRFLAQKDTQRREYIVLVRNLILIYIHYLWTAPESCLLAKALNDLFPGSLEGVDEPSELLFHVDLSDDEKEYFQQFRSECSEWLNLVVDWEDKRKETCECNGQSQEDMDANFRNDFRHAFPEPEPSKPSMAALTYVNNVEGIVRKLEQWFPPS